MSKIRCKNLLLVAGSGQNTGKTSLICAITQKLSLQFEVTTLKISPHFHKIETGELVEELPNFYRITRETSQTTGKDSSRMLAAGAANSYYLQVEDSEIHRIIPWILNLCKKSNPIICESGGLRKMVNPGLFFICNSLGNTIFKAKTLELLPLANRQIDFSNSGFTFDLHQINFNFENGFVLENGANTTIR